MALAAGLKQILKPEVVERATDQDAIELWEKKPEVNMRVRVVGLPAEFIAIRTDCIGHVSKIREGPKKQICDYLVLTESGDRIHAIFVELKKTKKSDDKPREQLRRSLPILKYLRSVWEIESETLLSEHGIISVHYSILFEQTSQRLAKQPVRADPARRVDTEEYKGLKIRTSSERRFLSQP